MKISQKITEKKIVAAVKRRMKSADANPGYCLHCGTHSNHCEPDAEHYRCNRCGSYMVFGAEEILLRGLFGGREFHVPELS